MEMAATAGGHKYKQLPAGQTEVDTCSTRPQEATPAVAAAVVGTVTLTQKAAEDLMAERELEKPLSMAG